MLSQIIRSKYFPIGYACLLSGSLLHPVCQSNFASGNVQALWGDSSKITSEF